MVTGVWNIKTSFLMHNQLLIVSRRKQVINIEVFLVISASFAVMTPKVAEQFQSSNQNHRGGENHFFSQMNIISYKRNANVSIWLLFLLQFRGLT